MIILGLIILLIAYLLVRHPLLVIAGWVIFGIGVLLLILHLTGAGLHAVTY
ncbi:MAG: hypothetical protein JOY78_20210 [Pseudonocardia sp.]|nr:hypothetical protein [Pseudonocardia sp.]